MPVQYDETASVGRRYRRQDEIGTPWCITVDSQSLEDGTVTIRDRDSMAQERIPTDGVTAEVQRRLRLPWQRPGGTSRRGDRLGHRQHLTLQHHHRRGGIVLPQPGAEDDARWGA